ncbi:tripartite motif-containing protein 43-like [Sarcophilus harrisii]|uniref:tripartite motif-containing protein 43-like n=1 Tax=Sarcophilus harrisii TaxID=9305 RepID=UPI001301ED40|nr:tripartite motif-containing protein 43-like [Sarcophilus harrisii]
MDATAKFLKELQSEITCSICRGYFCEPVTIRCGHSFCRACLSSSWRNGAPAFSCPECRQDSQDREIPLVNRCLAELSELGKELSSKLMQSTEGQSHCVTHKKLFKLFCDEDQIQLCVTCYETPEHGAQKISLVQESAHKYRRELENLQIRLEKHLEEDEQLLAQEERTAVDWHGMIMGEFDKLHHFLMEEENLCLKSIREEQKASQDRLSQHMQSLQDLMQELQEASHQANLDLLQDAKQLLGRSEAVLAKQAKAVIPELREYPIHSLIEMFNRFRVDLTLDPRSATSCVTISEDLKHVKARGDWEVGTKAPEDCLHHYVFAKQVFSSGSKYWEVDVTQLPQWILGIYTPNLKRKRARNVASCTSVFLLQCVKKEGDYYLQTYPGPLNHQMKSPLSRVGVYLEYSLGTLAFYNVLQSSLIYNFHSISFKAPVTPIFSPGPPLPGTKPGPMTLCPVDSHLCACCYSSQ